MAREIDIKVLKKLDEWDKESPSGPIELYLRLVRLQTESKSDIKLPDALLSHEVISERLSNAIPLLTFDDLVLDWAKIESLLREALTIINEYSSSAAVSGELPLKELSRAWYDGKRIPKQSIDKDTLNAALHTALKPFLSVHAEVLLTEIEQGKWRRGYCPICGSKPNFALLSKEKEGARWLICPRCDAQWLFQRLECPFCGNKDQKKLSYRSDDDGVYRLYLCEECKGYLKCIDMRQVEDDVVLQLEWIATLDLDKQACESGYMAGDLTPKQH
jgi:FdhE protein